MKRELIESIARTERQYNPNGIGIRECYQSDCQSKGSSKRLFTQEYLIAGVIVILTFITSFIWQPNQNKKLIFSKRRNYYV